MIVSTSSVVPGPSAVLTALTGAASVVAPYPHSTREPALGPLEDPDGHLLELITKPYGAMEEL